MRVLRYVLYQGRRRVLFVLVPAILVFALAYGVASAQPTTYQATTTLYVQQVQGGAINFPLSIQAAQEYAAIINVPVIALQTERIMSARYHYPNYNLFNHHYAASTPKLGNTPLIYITVQDTSARRAASGSAAAAAAFIQRVQQLQLAAFTSTVDSVHRQLTETRNTINSLKAQIATYQGTPNGLVALNSQLASAQARYQQLQQATEQIKTYEQSLLNSITVYQAAGVPSAPSGPHPLKQSLLLGGIALILSAGAVFLTQYFSHTPRTPETVAETAGAPVLGSVPRYNKSGLQSSLVTFERPASAVSEAYRVIRTNVQFTDPNRLHRTLLITSPHVKEGKSTTASNLARVIADSGTPVTLVDSDLRRPSLQRIFGSNQQKGLTNLLLGESLNGHADTEQELGIRLILAGPRPPNPSVLLGSERMHDVLDELRGASSIVLLDAPPVLGVSDTLMLAASADGVILVVDPNKSTTDDIRRSREAIEGVGGKIVGVVVNGVDQSDPYYYASEYGAEA